MTGPPRHPTNCPTRPSEAARGRKMGTLRTIGVLLPDLGNAYFFDVIKQMDHHATAGNDRMLMADSHHPQALGPLPI